MGDTRERSRGSTEAESGLQSWRGDSLGVGLGARLTCRRRRVGGIGEGEEVVVVTVAVGVDMWRERKEEEVK